MMEYDYIITKPPLDDETLMHYGIKGMKWRRKKGRKSKTISRSRKKIKKYEVPGHEFGEGIAKLLDKGKAALYNNSETYRKYYNWTTDPTINANASNNGNQKYSQEEIDYWSQHTDELDNGPGDLKFKYEMHEAIKENGGKRRRKTNR